MDDIDKILMDAVHDSCHAEFQPRIDHVLQALPVLYGMKQLMEEHSLVDEDGIFSIMAAIGTIIMHLEHAYPELKTRLKNS